MTGQPRILLGSVAAESGQEPSREQGSDTLADAQEARRAPICSSPLATSLSCLGASSSGLSNSASDVEGGAGAGRQGQRLSQTHGSVADVVTMLLEPVRWPARAESEAEMQGTHFASGSRTLASAPSWDLSFSRRPLFAPCGIHPREVSLLVHGYATNLPFQGRPVLRMYPGPRQG